MKKLLLLCFLLQTSFCFGKGKFYGLRWDGHHEYFCSIDTSGGGSYHDIDSIPNLSGVVQGASCIDKTNGKYFFSGIDLNGNSYFYAIDIYTGNILTKTPIRGLDEFVYNAGNSKVYGLSYSKTRKMAYYSRLDTSTGSTTILDSIPHFTGLVQGSSDINTHANIYYFEFIDDSGKYILDAVNITTGSTIKKIGFRNCVTNFQYSESRSGFYGMVWNNSNKEEYMVKIDSLDSPVTIDSIATLKGMVQGVTDFDQDHGNYIFMGLKSGSIICIYSVDASSARVLSKISLAGTGITDFQFFGSAYSATLSGEIKTHTNAALKNSSVYLCRFDSSDSTVIVLDSMKTDTSGHYSFTTSDSVVYVFAEPNISSYPHELPTWADSGSAIQYSNVINLHSGSNTKNFKTLYGTNPGGSGYVGGKITICSMCKNAKGQPANHLRVILADANGKPVASTYTDVNGNFSFKNIQLSDYRIQIDYPKVNNSLAPAVKLTSASPSLSNLSFTLYPTYLAMDKTSGIAETPITTNSAIVYPNPFGNNFTMQYSLNKPGRIIISLSDIAGKEIYHFESMATQAGDYTLPFDGSTLKTGIYFLSLRTNDYITNRKIVKSGL